MKKVILSFLTLLAVLAMGAGGASPTLATQGEDHKVGICHRTASDTNPYVYIEVDVASLSPGHLGNADPGHKPTFWKSDGVFRGVPHSSGDPKDDYLAPGGAANCEDFPPTPSESATPSDVPCIPRELAIPSDPENTLCPAASPSPVATDTPKSEPTLPPTDTTTTVTTRGYPLALVIAGVIAVLTAVFMLRHPGRSRSR